MHINICASSACSLLFLSKHRVTIFTLARYVAKWPPLRMDLMVLSGLSWPVGRQSKAGAHPKTQMFMGERVRINVLFARWVDSCLSSCPSLSFFLRLSLFSVFCLSGGCKAGVCLKLISHGISKCYTGKSAAQRTEKPALPPAGPCQHVEGATCRDPQITTAMHR